MKNSVVGKLRAELLDYAAQHYEMETFEKVRHALEIAQDAHVQQTRDDKTPYILHPLRIALSLIKEFDIDDAEIICGALLHDVSEDHAQYTPASIEAKFGIRVGFIVCTLTKPDGKTREDVNKIYFERLWNSNDDCKLVKLADKLDNLRDAVNSPSPAKRRRTRIEAENFYLSLCGTLIDVRLQRTFCDLLCEAIDLLKNLDADV